MQPDTGSLVEPDTGSGAPATDSDLRLGVSANPPRRRLQARFLLTSTSEVYGDPLEHPQTEVRTRPTPAPPYGVAFRA